MFVDRNVDGIMVVMVTECVVCRLGSGWYNFSVGDGGMCCLLIGIRTILC